MQPVARRRSRCPGWARDGAVRLSANRFLAVATARLGGRRSARFVNRESGPQPTTHDEAGNLRQTINGSRFHGLTAAVTDALAWLGQQAADAACHSAFPTRKPVRPVGSGNRPDIVALATRSVQIRQGALSHQLSGPVVADERRRLDVLVHPVPEEEQILSEQRRSHAPVGQP